VGEERPDVQAASVADRSALRLPAALVILDGWGLCAAGPGNAVEAANTPNLDALFATRPWAPVKCSGLAVGLPEGQMGNSEVGHLNIGAGRVVYQELTRITAAIADGSLDLASLPALPDDEVDRRLTAISGIGRWTTTIYRLMVLLRPDAWPIHDIALAQAIADVRGLDVRPSPGAMDDLAEGWRPWRAVAARLLWHEYLSARGRPG